MVNFLKVIPIIIILTVLIIRKMWLFSQNWAENIKDPSIRRYSTEIGQAAINHGVPPEIIAGVMWQESRGAAGAVGSVGEIGLMQLRDIAVQDLFQNGLSPRKTAVSDPALNVMDGAGFLRLQYRRVGGNWFEALRAYNGGFAGAKRSVTIGRDYAESVMRKAREYGYIGS